MTPRVVLPSVVLVVCLLVFVEGKLLSGSVDSTETTVFFGKFTFSAETSTDQGTLLFEVSDVAPEYDSVSSNILLNFYTNEPDRPWYFPDIWDNPNLTCEEKVALQYPVGGEYGVPVNGTDLMMSFSDQHEITWFWTISDCNLAEGQYLQMHTEMHWQNPGSWWYQEFSLEDQSLLTIYFIFFFFWITLSIFTCVCIFFFFTKKNREIDWNMYLFTLSLFAITLAGILYLIHYMTYAGDGIGIPSFLVVADVLFNLSEILIMVTFIQIASLVGSPDQLHIVIKYSAGLLLGVYLFGFFWQEIYTGLNPTELIYKWDTIPGIIMLVGRLLVWCMFVLLCIFNGYYNSDRRWFLGIFFITFSVWFLILPFMVIVMTSANYIYQWKVVLGVVQTFYFILYCIFLLLATPNPISSKINGVGFYVRKLASGLSAGNANFMSTLNSEDDL